jgi:glutamate N-acetyltransferase/amino-acid N-acetyltransferase
VDREAGITHPEGFVAAGVRCGLKSEGYDLALIVSETAATVAGVFTTNQVQAASVRWSRRVVRTAAARAVLVNAGNANACNGSQGETDTAAMAQIAADLLGVSASEVLVAQTGVIGHPMPMEKVRSGIPEAVDRLMAEPAADRDVSRAIMTTDLVPKTVAATVETDTFDGILKIGGVCKGSGMIAPNMATMLAFFTTDARISTTALNAALGRAAHLTFNRMTVDGDTSTNDMMLVLAGGLGEVEIPDEGPAFEDFCEALRRSADILARAVARDGEGATKLVLVTVAGAATEAGADRIARTIAESPLVKTALFGNDPNWGRIMMAAGRAGVAFDPDRVQVRLGPHTVFHDGTGVAFDRKAASDYLAQEEVEIVVNLHLGDCAATVYTCDFSYDYVRINAEYHT